MAAGIENPDVIDLVSENASGEYALIMIETRPWDDSAQQLQQLRQKINTYAMFVLDEGLIRTYPETAGKPLRIQLDCPEPPTTEAAKLIQVASQRFADYGIRFVVNVLDQAPNRPQPSDLCLRRSRREE